MRFQDIELSQADWHDGPRTLSEGVHVQVKTRVLALDQLKEDLVENFRQWRPTRQRTREKLEELASKLQEQHIRGSKS
ncbi:unnamed protein product, partial [Pocillopora meandrina]